MADRDGDADEQAATGEPYRVPGEQPGTGSGLTGGDEVIAPGADAGVTSSTRATATGANLGETEATREAAEDAGR